MRIVLAIWIKELKESLREFHVLVLGIGFPLLFYPLILLGVFQLQSLEAGRLAEKPPKVAVEGPIELEPALLEAGLELTPTPPSDEIAHQMAEEQLDLAIVTQTVDQSNEILILYDGSSSRSNATKKKLLPIIEDLESAQIAKMERSLDLPEGDLLPFEVTEVNTASEGQKMAMILSMIIPLFLLMCMVMSGIYPTVELVTGERVRQTLETTMCSPAPRWAIVTGKILTVITLMVLAVVANGVSMGLTLLHTVAMMTDSIPSVSLDFSDIAGTLPLLISTLLLAATIFVLAALPCQTIKSSQNAVSMVSIVLILPCMIGVVPGIENDIRMASIPFSNTALILRDVLNGQGLSPLAWLGTGVNTLLAFIGLWLANRIAQSEHFLFGPSTGGLKRWRLILSKRNGGAQ